MTSSLLELLVAAKNKYCDVGHSDLGQVEADMGAELPPQAEQAAGETEHPAVQHHGGSQ